MRKYYEGLLFTICIIFFFSSCINPKSITYFNDLPQATRTELDSVKIPEPLILVNDILEIRVGGENEATVQYLNNFFGGIAGGIANTGQQFVVDVNGNITLPKIGTLKMGGLTREQARDTLTNAYKQYLLDPVVSVKFSNFRFAVLGEVKIPGNYSSSADKVSIFEALAQAGDITEFGHFENVKIIRDINGKRAIITLNLLEKRILNSPDYYINRYDIIYVQSRNLKSVTENFARTASFIATITSVLAIVLVLFKK